MSTPPTLMAAVALALIMQLGQPAAATSIPPVSACLSSQLTAGVTATIVRVVSDRHKHPDQWFTNINVFVRTSVPCDLTGSPKVDLLVNGKPLNIPHPDPPQYELTPTGAVDFATGGLVGGLMIPGHYAGLAAGWEAPWCGKPVMAALDITLALDHLTTKAAIPSPPCRKGWPARFTSDRWVFH